MAKPTTTGPRGSPGSRRFHRLGSAAEDLSVGCRSLVTAPAVGVGLLAEALAVGVGLFCPRCP